MFLNFYQCSECAHEWYDVYEHTCDDRCPLCNTSNSPYKSEDILKAARTLDGHHRRKGSNV